jgi:hypothetical protein
MFEDDLLMSTKYMDSKTGECDSTVPVPIIFENTSPVNDCLPNGNVKELKFKVKSFVI